MMGLWCLHNWTRWGRLKGEEDIYLGDDPEFYHWCQFRQCLNCGKIQRREA